jgi:hypothetical protein
MTWRPGGLHGFPGARGTSVTLDAGSSENTRGARFHSK